MRQEFVGQEAPQAFALSSSALSNPTVLLVRGDIHAIGWSTNTCITSSVLVLWYDCCRRGPRLERLSIMVQKNLFLLVREVLRALEHGKLPSPALFRQLLSKAGIVLVSVHQCGLRMLLLLCTLL